MHTNGIFSKIRAHFFAKSGHFFLFLKKGRGDSPPSANCVPEMELFVTKSSFDVGVVPEYSSGNFTLYLD